MAESSPMRHGIKALGHRPDATSESENALQVYYHSNPSREYCNLPEWCCYHCEIGVEKPEDTVPGTHREHRQFSLDHCTGNYL